jgi:hypothetical protein
LATLPAEPGHLGLDDPDGEGGGDSSVHGCRRLQDGHAGRWRAQWRRHHAVHAFDPAAGIGRGGASDAAFLPGAPAEASATQPKADERGSTTLVLRCQIATEPRAWQHARVRGMAAAFRTSPAA